MSLNSIGAGQGLKIAFLFFKVEKIKGYHLSFNFICYQLQTCDKVKHDFANYFLFYMFSRNTGSCEGQD